LPLIFEITQNPLSFIHIPVFEPHPMPTAVIIATVAAPSTTRISAMIAQPTGNNAKFHPGRRRPDRLSLCDWPSFCDLRASNPRPIRDISHSPDIPLANQNPARNRGLMIAQQSGNASPTP